MTPFFNLPVIVPLRTPGPESRDRVTVVLLVVSTLPSASWAATLMLGFNALPIAPAPACWVTTRRPEASSAEIVNWLEVAPGNAPSVAARRYLPDLSRKMLEKVATPLTACTVVAPTSVAPNGPVEIARVTEELSAVSTTPLSRISTTYSNVSPATAVVGCWAMNNCAASITRDSNASNSAEKRAGARVTLTRARDLGARRLHGDPSLVKKKR